MDRRQLIASSLIEIVIRGVFGGRGLLGHVSPPLAPKAPSHPVAALDGETTFWLLRPQKDAVLKAAWTAEGVPCLFSVLNLKRSTKY